MVEDLFVCLRFIYVSVIEQEEHTASCMRCCCSLPVPAVDTCVNRKLSVPAKGVQAQAHLNFISKLFF